MSPLRRVRHRSSRNATKRNTVEAFNASLAPRVSGHALVRRLLRRSRIDLLKKSFAFSVPLTRRFADISFSPCFFCPFPRPSVEAFCAEQQLDQPQLVLQLAELYMFNFGNSSSNRSPCKRMSDWLGQLR
jgi:hypothetical protein